MLPNREGQRVPNVTFHIRRNNEWVDVTTDELFAGKTVVVFALPGAFTPTCSSSHLPGYNELAPAFKEIVLGKDITTRSLRAVTGATTVPQVFIDGKLIGSSEALEAYLKA